MIVKKYTIPVYRELASSEIVKTNIEDSSFVLEVDTLKNIELNKDFETIIFSVDKQPNQLVIYSNTLNIKVTDKFYNNIPLYFKKTFLNEFDYKDFIKGREEFLVEYEDTNFIVYFNKEEDELISEVVELNVVNNPLKRSDNVKVRKLKNRLKITIKNINENIAKVALPSRYLFEPKIYKNFIEFYESILNINNTSYYFYNSSFNLFDKREYTKNESLVKDPVIEYLGYFENIQNYTTWRSNLLYDQKLSTDLYYYLKLDSPNKTDLIVQSIIKINEPNHILLFSTSYLNTIKNLIVNPYTESTVSTPIGENYSLVYKEVEDNKYNRYNDIKFGTDKLVLDFEKNVKNKVKYIQTSSNVIYQEDVIDTLKEYPEKEYTELPAFFLTNISNLKNKIESIKEQDQGIDNKIYKGT